jgi:DNA-binding NtrC family response regulator
MVSLYLPAQKESRMFLLPETGVKADNFVLLMEPEQQMAEIGKIMLTYLGFSVKVAADRAGAVEEIRQFTDNPLLPRPLVILALTDAKGESAVETCRLLHEVDPQLKVIAMSGTILGPVMENCQKYGFINTLPKPFSMDSLKHITNTVLQS